MDQIPAPNPQLRASPQYRALMENELREKPVTAVPGIGPAAERELDEDGIRRASQLLGMYLQNPLNFQAFSLLMKTYHVDENDARDAYDTLHDFSDIKLYRAPRAGIPVDVYEIFRTSAKYRALMDNPLGEQLVTAVPGIARAAQENLILKRIATASQLLGMYLQNPSTFRTTLEDDYGVRVDYAESAYCLA